MWVSADADAGEHRKSKVKSKVLRSCQTLARCNFNHSQPPRSLPATPAGVFPEDGGVALQMKRESRRTLNATAAVNSNFQTNCMLDCYGDPRGRAPSEEQPRRCALSNLSFGGGPLHSAPLEGAGELDLQLQGFLRGFFTTASWLEEGRAREELGGSVWRVYRAWLHALAEERRGGFEEALERAQARAGQLGAGMRFACAVRTDGQLRSWGSDNYQGAPVAPLRGPGPFKAVACGSWHTLALLGNGQVECHGCNEKGQSPPEGRSGFKWVAAGGSHSLGLRSDGGVECWGHNYHGQAPPEGRPGLYKAVAAGDDHSLGLMLDGGVDFWGLDDEGQAPAEGRQGEEEYVAIAAGAAFSLALRKDGRIAAWGDIQPAPPDERFVAMDAGSYHAIGLRANGSVLCWGSSEHGQQPVQTDGHFIAVGAGNDFSLGLLIDGVVLCWGHKTGFGQAPPEGVRIDEAVDNLQGALVARASHLAV